MHYMKRPRESDEPRLLPLDYVAGPNVVMIGRGRRCLNNEGNRRFRAMVKAELQAYSVGRKAKKSSIIKRILREIRDSSLDGVGFIKQDAMTGRYYTATTTAAKVTIAQAFRDALDGTIGYKSSKQHKQLKRDIARGKLDPNCLMCKDDETGICSSCNDELHQHDERETAAGDHGDIPSEEPPHFWKDDMGPIVHACESQPPMWTKNEATRELRVDDPQEAFPVAAKDVYSSSHNHPEPVAAYEPLPPLKKLDITDPFAPIPLQEAMQNPTCIVPWCKHSSRQRQVKADDSQHSSSHRVSLGGEEALDDDDEEHAMVAWASEFVHCPLCSLVQGRGDFEELPIHDIRQALIG